MADGTKIEWTDATWNVITGCSVTSPGCTNCYAMRLAGTRLRHHPTREGLTRDTKAGPVWNGQVRFNEQMLRQPLQWKRPRLIFVCAHADLFHENVPEEWIDRAFAVMAACPQHTFQVLTKRPERMRDYCRRLWACGEHALAHIDGAPPEPWPFGNVWLGVSVEDQARADQRIPILLETPARVRWLSMEPLLGPVRLDALPLPPGMPRCECADHVPTFDALNGTIYCAGCCEGPERMSAQLDWIVLGGESGPGSRAMHPDWARSVRDQCADAETPFHFKQWGDWAPSTKEEAIGNPRSGWKALSGRALPKAEELYPEAGAAFVAYLGKKVAGRLLDGVQHDGWPEARSEC